MNLCANAETHPSDKKIYEAFFFKIWGYDTQNNGSRNKALRFTMA